MIRDPRFRTPDDELAVRLSRYWDSLVDDDAVPATATADLGDLAVIVRGLADLPRDPAPKEIHRRAQARLSADPDWLTLLTTRPHIVTESLVVPNGYRPAADATEETAGERAPTPLRRTFPVVELAALAAAILLLLYVAFGRDRQAQQPTPTASPAPTAAPTATGALPTPTTVASAVGDWPMLGGGPTRTGGADRAVPANAPAPKWTATLPAGIHFPVAAGDAVYVSNGGVIVALDAATGTERWRFDMGVASSVAGANPPAVVGGVLYAAAHDGTVFALDAATGKPIWSHETNGTVSTGIAVANGIVYVGTNEGTLYALDATTGDQRWSYPTGPISISSPVIADGTVYVGGGGDKLFALDAVSGLLRWQHNVKPGMQSVTVGDGLAVASGINTSSAVLLIAVDASDGAARWQSGRGADLPPAIVSGTVYVTGGTDVVALAGDRGTPRWAFNASLKVIDVAVAGDALLLCRQDGTAIALDAATGKERWRVATGGTATGVAVGSKVMYVAHGDGSLTAYD